MNSPSPDRAVAATSRWTQNPTLGDRLGAGTRANNFDTLRLLASCAVLVSHSFPVGEGIGTPEPMSQFTHGTTLGSLAVAAFFIFSGFLVANSADRTGSLARFAQARALRILPGLGLLMLITTFVIGPLATSLPTIDYLTSPQTYDYLQGVYFRFRTTLPGVFESNPYPNSMNNSLWSLRVEVIFYVATAISMVSGLHRRWVSVGALLLAVLLNHWTAQLPDAGIMSVVKSCAGVAPYYFVGSVFFFFRSSIRLSVEIALAAGLVCVLLNVIGFPVNELCPSGTHA